MTEFTFSTLVTIENAIWAGKRDAAIAKETGVDKVEVGKVREWMLRRLQTPEAIKAAANGPVINPNAINRPKAPTRRSCPTATQVDMFG